MSSFFNYRAQSALERAQAWWDAEARTVAREGVVLWVVSRMPRCLDEFTAANDDVGSLARCMFADLPPCVRHWLQVQAREPTFPLHLAVMHPIDAL